MSKKVSNTAERDTIERTFRAKFKFPNLYSPSVVIDGTEESTLSIITSDNPDEISYAIWGMLPKNYEEDWKDFQYALDTINVSKESIPTHDIFKSAYEHNRCLIIVTGYFIYHLHEGMLFPYYVYHAQNQPFCLAGIYNTLEDGFITCSMLNAGAIGIVDSIQNIEPTMPISMNANDYKQWLNVDAPMDSINEILNRENTLELLAHPVAKEFFKNGITYDSVLEPVLYKNIPLGN